MLALLVTAVGCEHADPFVPPGGGVEPKLSSIQEFIFDRSCAIPTCHTGGGAPLGLNLDAGQARGNLVNIPSGQSAFTRVIPAKPDSSYLVMKLEGTMGISGQRMPRNAAPLSSSEIQAIRDWIANGAADD